MKLRAERTSRPKARIPARVDSRGGRLQTVVAALAVDEPRITGEVVRQNRDRSGGHGARTEKDIVPDNRCYIRRRKNKCNFRPLVHKGVVNNEQLRAGIVRRRSVRQAEQHTAAAGRVGSPPDDVADQIRLRAAGQRDRFASGGGFPGKAVVQDEVLQRLRADHGSAGRVMDIGEPENEDASHSGGDASATAARCAVFGEFSALDQDFGLRGVRSREARVVVVEVAVANGNSEAWLDVYRRAAGAAAGRAAP